MSAVQPSSEVPARISSGARAGATVLRMMLGAQLRRFRETADITPDRAGYEIRASRSKISRMEHGRVGFKDRDVADLLTLYGVTDEDVRAGLLSLAQQANAQGWWAQYGDILPDWFEAYLGLEAAASLIRTFELQFVHGLFQTDAYARAVTMLGHGAAPAEEIDRRVSLRMERQALLTSPDPPRLWSVVDEAALRRPLGGQKVMRAVHRAALRRARPARCGVHRAAHQRSLPRKTHARRSLHGGHESPQRRGRDPHWYRAVHRADRPGHLAPRRPLAPDRIVGSTREGALVTSEGAPAWAGACAGMAARF